MKLMFAADYDRDRTDAKANPAKTPTPTAIMRFNEDTESFAFAESKVFPKILRSSL